MEQQRTHILVIGSGYAGMEATVRLAMKTRRENIQITLVNPSGLFIERPRLHQYAANRPVKQRPIREILRGTGVQFMLGEVKAIDVGRREVVVQTAMDSQRLGYDYLLYTAGSVTDQDRVPGVRAYAYTLAPAGSRSAETLRSILPDLDRQRGRVVIVGAGPTGIEAAAEFAESYSGLHVRLVTQGVLGGLLGGKIQAHIRKVLTRLGVAVQEQTMVERVGPNELVTAKGEMIPFDLCLWTGGFVAPALAREAGLAVNAYGQMLTDPTLRSITSPWIYAAGDSAQPVPAYGMRVRMAAYTAAITGAHAADSLYNAMMGRPQKSLNFAYLGQGIALGRHEAVDFNNFPDDTPKWPVLTGQFAVLGRAFFVHLLADLPGIERRLPGLHFWPGRRNSIPAATFRRDFHPKIR